MLLRSRFRHCQRPEEFPLVPLSTAIDIGSWLESDPREESKYWALSRTLFVPAGWVRVVSPRSRCEVPGVLCGQPPPCIVPAREQGARNVAPQVEIRLTYDPPALLIARILPAKRSSPRHRLRELGCAIYQARYAFRVDMMSLLHGKSPSSDREVRPNLSARSLK